MSKFVAGYFLTVDCYDRTNIDKPVKLPATFRQ